MECQVSILAHDDDCGIYEKDNDDDSTDGGYKNNIQEADTDVDDAAAYEDKRERERNVNKNIRKRIESDLDVKGMTMILMLMILVPVTTIFSSQTQNMTYYQK